MSRQFFRNRIETGDIPQMDAKGTPYIYGVRWDSVNDVMTAGIVLGGVFVGTDYTTFFIQEKMVRGLLTEAGAWTALNASDTAKLVSGAAATIDGSAGQVVTRLSSFYHVAKTDGNYKYWLISEDSFTFGGVEAWVPPAFIDKPYLYIGAFQGVALTDSATANVGSCVKNTSGYSYATPNPFTDQTIVEFRAQCNHGVFSQMNLGQFDIVYLLALIEYKTWKLQEELEGHTEEVSWDYAKTKEAGETTGLGNASGTVNSVNSYRGIENIFGNVYQFVDGANINASDDQRLWMCYDPDNYASDTVTNYTDTGCASAIDGTNDYIKDVYGTGKHCSLFPIGNTGATSATFISDYLYTAALGSGWRVLVVGGGLSKGRMAGFGGRYSAYDSSSHYATVGVRLAAAYV